MFFVVQRSNPLIPPVRAIFDVAVIEVIVVIENEGMI